MKDQYAGDVNDYVKYAMLREIAARTRLRLAVCWMMTPPDARSDGNHTAYLRRPTEWRPLDPDLFDELRRLVEEGRRTVREIETRRLAPASRFVRAFVPRSETARRRWFTDVLRGAADTDVLFFDPDNGLEVRSVPRGRAGSERYLRWDEVRHAFATGRSLIVYQHLPRVDRERFARQIADRLGEVAATPYVSTIHTSRVAFFVIAHGRHSVPLDAACRAFSAVADGRVRYDAWEVGRPARAAGAESAVARVEV